MYRCDQAHVPSAEGECVRSGSNAMYSFLLDFVAADNHRWKYVNGEWVPGGKPRATSAELRLHPPRLAELRRALDEDRSLLQQVKLTNKLNGGGQVRAHLYGV